MFAGNVIRYLVFAVAIALAEMIILMNSPKVPDCSPKPKLTKTDVIRSSVLGSPFARPTFTHDEQLDFGEA